MGVHLQSCPLPAHSTGAMRDQQWIKRVKKCQIQSASPALLSSVFSVPLHREPFPSSKHCLALSHTFQKFSARHLTVSSFILQRGKWISVCVSCYLQALLGLPQGKEENFYSFILPGNPCWKTEKVSSSQKPVRVTGLCFAVDKFRSDSLLHPAATLGPLTWDLMAFMMALVGWDRNS